MKNRNFYGTSSWNNYVKEKEELYKNYHNIETNVEQLEYGYTMEHNAIQDDSYMYRGDKCKLFLNGKKIFEWTNYYGKSLLHRIIEHSNGKKYFIYNEDLYGYSVLDLSDFKTINYLPYEYYGTEDNRLETFIFYDAYYNKYNDYIAIEGCMWATPYSVMVFSFKNPMKIKEFEYWNDLQDDEFTELNFVSWDKNKLILEYDETKQLICFDINDYCVK